MGHAATATSSACFGVLCGCLFGFREERTDAWEGGHAQDKTGLGEPKCPGLRPRRILAMSWKVTSGVQSQETSSQGHLRGALGAPGRTPCRGAGPARHKPRASERRSLVLAELQTGVTSNHRKRIVQV